MVIRWGKTTSYNKDKVIKIIHGYGSSGFGGAIKQVVHNLLSNAIKFTPANKNIYLDVAYENEILHVSVKDEGIGISKEYQEKIFDSFTQADVSTTRQYGGTGLGLHMSAKIIKEGFKGDIEVINSDKGACFIIHFKS